jgi:hypothetical protein
LPIADEDGAITTDWQEGRTLDWQQPAKNPHPNRYHIVFKEGAFKEEHLAIFMSSDSRIKSIIQKENAKFAEVSRGAKRTRDDAKTPSKKADADAASDDEAKTSEKPMKKKAKIAETTAADATTSATSKPQANKARASNMYVDQPMAEETPTKPASDKAKKSTPVKKVSAPKSEEKKPSTPSKSTKKPEETESSSAPAKMDVDDTPSNAQKKDAKKTDEPKEKDKKTKEVQKTKESAIKSKKK